MKILKPGDTGMYVRWAQNRLIEAGYPLVIDGVLGARTTNAVLDFQKQHQLVADGIVGPATWRALGHEQQLRLQEDPVLQTVPMRPSHQISTTNIPFGAQHEVLTTWNKYGRLLQILAKDLMVEASALVAILAVESAGMGIHPITKLPTIRFENHIFYRYWGKYNNDLFIETFKFHDRQRWLDHKYKSGGMWFNTHWSQSHEYAAYNVAANQHADAAAKSIIMGAAQLMGFQYERLGYESPEQMLKLFVSEREHLLAFFQFLITDVELLTALQEQDWYDFVRIYNGSGQIEKYTAWIEQRIAIAADYNLF